MGSSISTDYFWKKTIKIRSHVFYKFKALRKVGDGLVSKIFLFIYFVKAEAIKNIFN